MSDGWIAVVVVAAVLLLFVGDWLLAGRTRRKGVADHEGRRLSRRSTSARDEVRASSQNNATRNSISGGGSHG